MSDYLGHLVERSFAPAPQIRPQLASLFEQPSATALETPAAFAQPPETNVDSTRTWVSPGMSPPPLARAVNPDDAGINSFQTQPRTRTHAESTVQPDSTKPSPAIIPPIRPSDADRPAAIVRPTGELTRHTSSDASHSQPADATPSVRHDVSSAFALVPPPGTHVPARLEPNRDDPPGRRTDIRPSSTVREVNHRSASQPGRNELRAVAPPANPPPAPSIHVTIGRVEVRVTPPTTPARSAQKKEPALSLDAYLRGRSQGGGR